MAMSCPTCPLRQQHVAPLPQISARPVCALLFAVHGLLLYICPLFAASEAGSPLLGCLSAMHSVQLLLVCEQLRVVSVLRKGMCTISLRVAAMLHHPAFCQSSMVGCIAGATLLLGLYLGGSGSRPDVRKRACLALVRAVGGEVRAMRLKCDWPYCHQCSACYASCPACL
jgi:hypothetical protein